MKILIWTSCYEAEYTDPLKCAELTGTILKCDKYQIIEKTSSLFHSGYSEYTLMIDDVRVAKGESVRKCMKFAQEHFNKTNGDTK